MLILFKQLDVAKQGFLVAGDLDQFFCTPQVVQNCSENSNVRYLSYREKIIN